MKNMMLQVKKYANIACFLGVLVALCVACQNGHNDPDAPAEYGPIAMGGEAMICKPFQHHLHLEEDYTLTLMYRERYENAIINSKQSNE